MGLCYHKQDSLKQAEEEYNKAINEAIKSRSDHIKASAYYNLGVLYYSQKKQDDAKTMFEKCIGVSPYLSPASKAREAIRAFTTSKSDVSQQPDRYNWWFLHNNKGKRILGILLIALMLSPIAIVALLISHAYYLRQDLPGWKDFSSVLITGVLLMMGLK